jgi:hypothetical protein
MKLLISQHMRRLLRVTCCYTLCYALQHRSRFENEGGERHAAQVGAWSQLRYDVREHVPLLRVHDCLVLLGRLVAAIVSSCLVYRGSAAA